MVARAIELRYTVLPWTKPDPPTVRVTSGPPAWMYGGFRLDTTGPAFAAAAKAARSSRSFADAFMGKPSVGDFEESRQNGRRTRRVPAPLTRRGRFRSEDA